MAATEFRRKSGLRCTLLLMSGLLAACTTIQPARVAPPSLEDTATIGHSDLDAVQRQFVDEQGRVDYAALKRHPGQLERYFLWMSQESPDSSPQRFPGQDAKLAYWLNAYNAAVLVTVLRNYPVQSVTEIGSYPPLSVVNDRLGFFVFQRVPIGGRELPLRDLRDSIILERYKDPRIHFALSDGSSGGPGLSREAFTGEHLHQQLDRKTRKYFANPANLRFDHPNQTVAVPAIFERYSAVNWSVVPNACTTSELATNDSQSR